MTPEERRKRMEERMASMTPEERERMQARMKEREAQGGGGFGGGPGGQQGARRRTREPGRWPQRGRSRRERGTRPAGVSPVASRAGPRIASGATTIDSLFAPLQTVETRGRAWLYENKQLKSVNVRLGVSDGTFSELIDGDLKEGQEVVVNMLTGLEPVNRPGQPATGNPLMGPQRGGPGGPVAAAESWRWRRPRVLGECLLFLFAIWSRPTRSAKWSSARCAARTWTSRPASSSPSRDRRGPASRR